MANYSVQFAYLEMKAFGECLFGLDTSLDQHTYQKKKKNEPKEKVNFSQKSQNSFQNSIQD